MKWNVDGRWLMMGREWEVGYVDDGSGCLPPALRKWTSAYLGKRQSTVTRAGR